ncbi:rRNA-binding ribosome biosynthesis protein [Starmerella bacillaris]|uniref:rRNA-binding ribosome biosynthesis protein n=1 Tax=Starmerella bacillaris TaxID=1247836 RepID=A0AAV5RP07_STABA|nr:rRNA-binding ribosome biosynthesis protein [Starmerella bacillaris]
MALTKDTVNVIRNKMKRARVLSRIKHTANKERHELRQKRARQEAANPELKKERLEKNITQTIESKRKYDETMQTVIEEDEFDQYFKEGKKPKVFITTSKKAKWQAFDFAAVLLDIIPDSEFFHRKDQFEIPVMAEMCAKRDYTDLIVINEDKKKVNGVSFIHLPEGPSFYFSISSLVMPEKIPNHGRATEHVPELILNNFSTRLGKTTGRLFHSLFPQQPEFQGRQVVTLHNQRDFIFFRRHRYVFRNEERVGLQELGPQFTLRLRRLQLGIRDEIEFQHHPGLDKDKHKFYL